MNRKSVYFIFFIGLLAVAVFVSLSSPLTAQTTTDKKDSKPITQEVSKKSPADKTQAAKKKSDPVENADYWFDKGALCATYGNEKAAINYYQKAIKIDPKRSGAYFAQGVSYGQLGDFVKALPLIDKAIEMEPQNGLFIYGRGRVHLLAGYRQMALADFKKAAELDDEDAQTYMETMAQTE